MRISLMKVCGALFLSFVTGTAAGEFATTADKMAERELREVDWVRDTYVSPGHMNIGVMRYEKQWGSPMIGTFACAIMRRNGSDLTWVRFTDIEAIIYQKKSIRQAEISKFRCR